MKKIDKTKKGFTLVEMVLVIAIISILVFVAFREVSDYLQRAYNATATMEVYYQETNEAISKIPSL